MFQSDPNAQGQTGGAIRDYVTYHGPTGMKCYMGRQRSWDAIPTGSSGGHH
jgi:hypothetical protein